MMLGVHDVRDIVDCDYSRAAGERDDDIRAMNQVEGSMALTVELWESEPSEGSDAPCLVVQGDCETLDIPQFYGKAIEGLAVMVEDELRTIRQTQQSKRQFAGIAPNAGSLS